MRELAATLRRKFGVKRTTIPQLEEYRRCAQLVKPVPLAPPVCRDPDGDTALAAAVAAKAEDLTSGDADLLCLKTHQGIRILPPWQFLEGLDRRR